MFRFLILLMGMLTTRAGIRPLIATLVTGVVYQALIEDEQAHYVSRLVSLRSDTIWNFLGNGKVAGLQVSVFVFLIVEVIEVVVIVIAIVARHYSKRTDDAWSAMPTRVSKPIASGRQ